MSPKEKIDHESMRIMETLGAILPKGTPVDFERREGTLAVLRLGGRLLRARWVATGWPGQVRDALRTEKSPPDLVLAPSLSPGARALLSRAGIGWVDESGGAECAFGTIILSRTGHVERRRPPSNRWSATVQTVAEALLCDTAATVEAIAAATGISVGAATKALRLLSDAGLLVSSAGRGRYSARRVKDGDQLLEAYATAVSQDTAVRRPSLVVGGAWRDLLTGIREIGGEWDQQGLAWAATGAAAAEVLAPTLTTLGSAEIYVQADTMAQIEAMARKAGLKQIDGGRLTLKPFPTITSSVLASVVGGIRVVPWPRVYADLRLVGVRGEDAAEHLREVMRGR